MWVLYEFATLFLMENIHVFIGENSYDLLREKSRWIVEFGKKHGQENIGRINGAECSIRELLDEVSVFPFLAEKRLIVVEDIPKSTKEDIQLLVTCVHPSALIMFVDAKPDKRSGGVKELLKVSTIHTFEPLANVPLQNWMRAYGKEVGVALDPSAVQVLIEYVGSNQAMLAQEIAKLASFMPSKTIKKGDVELLCIPTDEGVIWKISDMLASGNTNGALSFAHRLIDRGGDAYGLWAILCNMLKNVVSVYAAVEAGMRSQEEIAAMTGIHPNAVRSLFPYCKRIQKEDLAAFLAWAASAERGLKTGEFRPTKEAPQEIDALVDAFILQCP